MNQRDVDTYISNIVIEGVRPSRSVRGSSSATLRTDLARLPFDEYRPVLDALKERIAKRLGIPADEHIPSGIFDGIYSERGEIKIAPFTKNVTQQELRGAIEAEIREAKARVSARRVGAADVTGGQEADGVMLQAAVKTAKTTQLT